MKVPLDIKGWLDYIDSIHPRYIDYSLDRILILAKKLHLTKLNSKIITITGTNGKGSTARVLETLLYSSNHSVGVLSSPHLFEINERIRINNSNISDELLIKTFNAIEQSRGEIVLTYFEYITLAALYAFKESALDYVILEVGLGGRLDAVNIVDSDIAIVTSIALDHQEYLGKDREAIGLEKAGVFRSGKDIICGDLNPTNSILTKAKDLKCKLYIQNKDFRFTLFDTHWNWSSRSNNFENLVNLNLDPENVSTSLMCIERLNITNILNKEFLNQQFLDLKLLGRFTTIQDKCKVVLDIAHNVQAISNLSTKISKLKNKGKTFAVFAMKNDKNILDCIEQCKDLFDYWFIPENTNEEMTINARYIESFQSLKLNNYTIVNKEHNVREYINEKITRSDQIVVFGSFNIVSTYLNMFDKVKT